MLSFQKAESSSKGSSLPKPSSPGCRGGFTPPGGIRGGGGCGYFSQRGGMGSVNKKTQDTLAFVASLLEKERALQRISSPEEIAPAGLEGVSR